MPGRTASFEPILKCHGDAPERALQFQAGSPADGQISAHPASGVCTVPESSPTYDQQWHWPEAEPHTASVDCTVMQRPSESSQHAELALQAPASAVNTEHASRACAWVWVPSATQS
jgi:hypothetical protein